MRLIRIVDRRRYNLGGLSGVELNMDVVHLGIQSRELDRIVHRSETVFLVVHGLRQLALQLVRQVDGLISQRSEIIEVEDEDFYQSAKSKNDRSTRQDMPHNALVALQQRPEVMKDVGKRLEHAAHYKSLRLKREKAAGNPTALRFAIEEALQV